MDSGDVEFLRGRPRNLLSRFHYGTLDVAGLPGFRHETARFKVVSEEYHRDDLSRYYILHNRELSSAARVDERLGRIVTICRPHVLQSEYNIDEIAHA